MSQSEPNIDKLLPWTNGELEALLLDLISHGVETAKADAKIEIEAGSNEQSADLLKDITAIANTYGEDHRDYGFLVYGVRGKTIVGVSATETDTDKLQNRVDQLLRTYVSPLPRMHVIGFETADAKKWGVLVIPPGNDKPYMFCKELPCQDPKRFRRKGEWFVRRGATTDVGLPEDLARIIQRQTNSLLEPLRESIVALKGRLGRLEERVESELFRVVKEAVRRDAPNALPDAGNDLDTELGQVLGVDLPARLRNRLRKPEDSLAVDLVREALAVKEYLNGAKSFPWVLRTNDTKTAKEAILGIEEKVHPLQEAVATIVLMDSEGTYSSALVRAFRVLSADPQPTVQFTRDGEALRFYPLGLLLYTAFVCGVIANRSDVLKEILAVPIKHRNNRAVSNLTDVFSYWSPAKPLFNAAFDGNWCEPICQRLRQVIGDVVNEFIADTSESEAFLRGEFTLALACIDAEYSESKRIDDSNPMPGLYLYASDSAAIIETLLREQHSWLNTLFRNPLAKVLECFDMNARKMVAPQCGGSNLAGLNTVRIHNDELVKRSASHDS